MGMGGGTTPTGLRAFDGVEDIQTDCKTHKVVVKGEKAYPLKLRLTNEWPSGVLNRASTYEIPPGLSDSSGSDPTISELVAEIKPASTVSSTELSTKPPNTTLSPYTFVERPANAHGAEKRSADVTDDSQYWRYDVSKRQKGGGGDTARLCFKFANVKEVKVATSSTVCKKES
ncbi:hypothetical protein M8C21_000858, partial [Ambrosia artemisiifolia]